MTFPYVYRWNRPEGAPRKGQPCAVTARGTMNSCRVQFPDGFVMITSRNAIRRAKPGDVCEGSDRSPATVRRPVRSEGAAGAGSARTEK